MKTSKHFDLIKITTLTVQTVSSSESYLSPRQSCTTIWTSICCHCRFTSSPQCIWMWADVGVSPNHSDHKILQNTQRQQPPSKKKKTKKKTTEIGESLTSAWYTKVGNHSNTRQQKKSILKALLLVHITSLLTEICAIIGKSLLMDPFFREKVQENDPCRVMDTLKRRSFP